MTTGVYCCLDQLMCQQMIFVTLLKFHIKFTKIWLKFSLVWIVFNGYRNENIFSIFFYRSLKDSADLLHTKQLISINISLLLIIYMTLFFNRKPIKLATADATANKLSVWCTKTFMGHKMSPAEASAISCQVITMNI